MCDLNILCEGGGNEVFLAGGFNNWQGEPMQMVGDGLWQKKVSLEEGEHKVSYVFIVDGEWMTADNPKTEMTESGEMTCRFTVKKEEPMDEEYNKDEDELKSRS